MLTRINIRWLPSSKLVTISMGFKVNTAQFYLSMVPVKGFTIFLDFRAWNYTFKALAIITITNNPTHKGVTVRAYDSPKNLLPKQV